MKKSSPLFLLCFSLFSMLMCSSSLDRIGISNSIRDGDTIVSTGERFELGFFSPGNSINRYVGIWYHKISPLTVVWVANRQAPLQDSSGILTITPQGSLLILNSTNATLWSSNSSKPVIGIPTARLLDSGNFMVRETNRNSSEESILWQSFDHPSDTLLPGMKLGIDKASGEVWSLIAWKSGDDPSPSDYALAVDPNLFSQLVVTKNGVVQSQSGPWNGEGYNGEPGVKMNPYLRLTFVYNDKEMFYNYEVSNSSVFSRLVFTSSVMVQRYLWYNATQGWVLYSTAVMNSCYMYGVCGPYGSCNIANYPLCSCLKGFKPNYPQASDSTDWAKGCSQETPVDCRRGDAFHKYPGLKLPDTRHHWYARNMSLDECRMMCFKNCSCTAYTNPDIRPGKNACLLWFGDLVDIRDTTDYPQDIYIRVASSSELLGKSSNQNLNANSSSRRRVKIVIISVAVSAVMVLLLAVASLLYWKAYQQRRCGTEEDLDSPFFDFTTVANATDNFSFHNKLGEGGFGPVYKGLLKDGQEIAVKRLSISSKQGLDEFKNEVMHIAKLQHRNLVRLLGYCIHLDEKILIYEHVPNNSLDSLIFDKTKSVSLDWPMRFNIINGISRGLLYLHQDSRLRIIHRDLKASNVLLDKEMDPKISDFGMARSFRGNESAANTRRVVGTYGYMSPEYAIDGIYSIKSDVYSFGVLLLEIVSGKRNRGFRHPDHNLNLLGHAWKLHMEDRALELIDAAVMNSYSPSEVQRSIHVGLLCVQRRPEDRPVMSGVVLMLSADGDLPSPNQPGFFNERDPFETDSSPSTVEERCSTNGISITLLDPR